MKTIRHFVVSVTTLFILTLATTSAFSQKLPNVQSIGVLAPGTIKIDGKQTEWGSSLQAYNKAIECSYTLANDQDNLYLIIQATDNGIIQKIVTGGITLTLGDLDKKSTITPVAITFLKTPSPDDEGISYELRSRKSLPDDVLTTLNKQVFSHIREIRISGAKDLADSVISIYNPLGIKAAGSLNHDKVYTAEFAIPLKYIMPVMSSPGNLNYRIQVNGLDTSGKDGYTIVGGRSVGAPPSESAIDHSSMMFLMSPTYLKGSYMLVK